MAVKMGRWAARGRMWAGRGLWGLCGLVLFPMASPGCGRGRLLAFPLGRGWGPHPAERWRMAGLLRWLDARAAGRPLAGELFLLPFRALPAV